MAAARPGTGGAPSTRTLPRSGRRRPATRRRSEVLPQPEGPISTTISPRRAERSMPSRTGRPPSVSETPESERWGASLNG